MYSPVAPFETRLITGEELLQMGDIGPCELVEGRIVPMSPPGEEHGTIEFTLGGELRNFVRQHKLGRVMGGEVGIYIYRDPDTVRGADVVFIAKERMDKRPGKGYLEVAPDLVVEIISPNDLWSEVNEKIEEYFTIGVERVWVGDPKTHTVRVYRTPTDVERLNEKDVLYGEGVLVGFALPVAEIFAD
ncbi:MAG: Uma2 family endonuclease [Chloroflexota bacterium]